MYNRPLKTDSLHMCLAWPRQICLLNSHVQVRIREQLSYVNHALYLLRTGFAKKPKAPV